MGMRRGWVVALLVAGVVCGTALAAGAASVGLGEISRSYASGPREAPANLVLRVPPGTVSARLVYERLAFGDMYVVEATLANGTARASVPMEHTTQPGLKYHWEALQADIILSTPETTLPFVDGGPMVEITAVGEQAAHDLGYSGGKLPGGASVPANTASLPLSELLAQAPISSRYMEIRSIAGSEIHKGLDFSTLNSLGNPVEGKIVRAMQAGYVHKTQLTDAGGWGIYVMLRHDGYNYYSHYGHLSAITVTEGAWVTKGQQIGLSGNSGSSSGPHLDAGFDIYVPSGPDSIRVILYPFRYFPSSYSPYTSTSFDFVQSPYNGWQSGRGSFTSVDVTAAGSSGGTISVYIRYREKGTANWSEATMLYQSGTTYKYWWPTSLAGKTMEYYVKVFRANVPGRYVTRPAKFDSADPGVYAQVLVQGV